MAMYDFSLKKFASDLTASNAQRRDSERLHSANSGQGAAGVAEGAKMADRISIMTMGRLKTENEILRDTLIAASDEAKRLAGEIDPPNVWATQLIQLANWMEVTANFYTQTAWVAETP